MKRYKTRMRALVIAVGGIVALLAWIQIFAQSRDRFRSGSSPSQTFVANAVQPQKQESFDAQLTERLQKLCDRAGGDVGVAVVHVETGRALAISGDKQLPLYSVFKLPLAVAVLKEVEENRLSLDRKVPVKPEEVAPGAGANSNLWRKPVEPTVAELLELSISQSDNTSTDKLLQLVGGPAAVTARMRALNLRNIDVKFSVREVAAVKGNYNTGAASDLAQLLVLIQKGEALRAPQLAVLLRFMEGATTGLRRLRGNLPPGTRVADKTGTGDGGSVTNDVGLITLPGGRGHLAMAVLLSGSKLSFGAQEKLIAELARAAYDAYVSQPVK